MYCTIKLNHMKWIIFEHFLPLKHQSHIIQPDGTGMRNASPSYNSCQSHHVKSGN